MRSLADDRYPTFASMTRRSFLRTAGVALASRFISVASAFFDWLTRMFTTDGDLRFAG